MYIYTRVTNYTKSSSADTFSGHVISINKAREEKDDLMPFALVFWIIRGRKKEREKNGVVILFQRGLMRKTHLFLLVYENGIREDI